MNFSDASEFVKSANAGLAPVNGLYVLYTDKPATPIPSASGAIISGGVLADVVSAVNTSSTEMGICRVPAICSNTVSGAVFSSGGKLTVYGNTGTYQNVCGMPYSAGVYTRAVMLVNLDRGSTQANGYMYDTGLLYDELTTPIVAPANGAITVIEEVTM